MKKIYIFFVIYIIGFVASGYLGCSNGDDCWTNGECVSGKCVCDKGWTGSDCSLLDLGKAIVGGAYGYSPNVSSWGGNEILIDGTYHLYVSEMVNDCGLCTWHTNSRIVHATSSSPMGPFKFHDQAMEPWAHNAQIVENPKQDGLYYLFHIGTGTGAKSENCSHTVSHSKSKHKPYHNDMRSSLAGGTFHTSKSVNGPWVPQGPPGLGGCNNPAPYFHPNGSILLTCKVPWSSYTAETWDGEYVHHNISFSGNPGKGTWEDPFVWRDTRGVYKMLCHVYISGNEAERVAGFAYSKNGFDWVNSPIEPYTNKVEHTDGVARYYSTRERPKLYLENNVPKVLFTGVGPVVGSNQGPCPHTFTIATPFN